MKKKLECMEEPGVPDAAAGPSELGGLMIDLNCPSCQGEMSLDEAFGGGVCRCHACGALITVPAAGQQNTPRQLILNRKTQRPATEGDALTQTAVFRTADGFEVELSDEEFHTMPVTRHRSGLQSSSRRTPARHKSGGAMPLMIGLGMVVLGGILILVLVSAGSNRSDDGPEEAASAGSQAVQPARIPVRSFTLDEYRRAIPGADDKFLMIQMNTGRSLEDARRAWEDEQARDAARRK